MLKHYLLISTFLLISGCVVVPELDDSPTHQCGLSTDKKTLKIVNLLDGDTSFYQWNDELLAIITLPTSAIVSGAYVAVNNVYHIGEKAIKCGNN